MYNEFEVRTIPMSLRSCREEAGAFLARFGLRLDSMDYYAGVYEGDRLLCAGGYEGSVVKCIAADPETRGLGLTNLLMSHLLSRLRESGVSNVFVFTKPENRDIFESLSFHTIGQAPRAILLESDSQGVHRFCGTLALHRTAGRNAAIVMNANPFTQGHRYLAETAAAACDHLHIFVVESERSFFPFEIRKKLVEQGVEDLKNVTVYSGGPYIISDATFPSYFLKEPSDAAETHALLDADVFAAHIAPALSVSTRFVGTEPLDKMTAAYNDALLQVLPARGVEVRVIARKTEDNAPVSASRVRALIGEHRIDEIRPLVPGSTFQYIKEHFS